MQKKVLFIGYDPALQEEIREFIKERGDDALFCDSTEQAIKTLDNNTVNTVSLSIRTLTDAAILKYINQYYPDIHVLISATREFDEIIDAFNKGHYSMLKQPLKMAELYQLI